MSYFCQAGIEATKCNFRDRSKCTVCWGNNCKYRGGSKVPRIKEPPRIKEAPRENKAPEKEKPHQEEIRTRAVSW